MNVTGLKKLINVIATKGVKKSTLLIWGPTGAGKTTVCKQMAKELGYEFLSFSCETLTDPADLRGGIVNVADGDDFVMKYSIPELVEHLRKRKTMILFDELVRTPPQSQAALMSVFTDEKRLGLHALPEDTLIVAAANPVGDDYFGNELDLAQAERFLHVSYSPDRAEVLDYLEARGMHAGIVSFFHQVPDAMYAPMLSLPYKPKACPRAIEAFGEMVAALNPTEFDDIGHEVAEGLVGEHASGLIQSIRNALETPLALEDILSGDGVTKLKGWRAKSVKVTLFKESLRNLKKGVKQGDKAYKAFEKDVLAGDTSKLNSLCGALCLFPMDLMREFIETIRSDMVSIFAAMIKRQGDSDYPAIGEFVKLVEELKAAEAKLNNR